jgi:hypothetical protein
VPRLALRRWLLRRWLLRCLLLRCVLVWPRRLSAPPRLGLPLAAVTAALVIPAWVAAASVLATAVAAASLRLTAPWVARTAVTRIVAVPALLTGLSCLARLAPTAQILLPGSARADGSEVRELTLILRRGVIPLPCGLAIVLTCPAATRPAGE